MRESRLERAANAIAAVLCEVCTAEEIEGVLATIHPDDWQRAARAALRESEAVILGDDALKLAADAWLNAPTEARHTEDRLRAVFKALQAGYAIHDREPNTDSQDRHNAPSAQTPPVQPTGVTGTASSVLRSFVADDAHHHMSTARVVRAATT